MANQNPEQLQDFEQLKLLFDYTKFHIGLYATLVTLIIALISLGSDRLRRWQRVVLAVTTVLFLFAGACGGVVATNIPNYQGMKAFAATEIGPKWLFIWESAPTDQSPDATQPAMWPKFKGAAWATSEHLFFWAGILVAVAGLIAGLFSRETQSFEVQYKLEIKS